LHSNAKVSLAARITVASLLALTLLELLWELVLAPIPGARWLALKALPLAILVPAVARGTRRARQWVALLAPWYMAEGIVRAYTEPGRHGLVAAMAVVFAVVTMVSVLAWFRAEKTSTGRG
jgi:uncharacterized membrane protein